MTDPYLDPSTYGEFDRILLCDWCQQPFTAPHRRGPKPKYCKPSHRQRAYQDRNWVRR